MTPVLQVLPYDAQWTAQFETLKERIWPWVGEHALIIEHVGSTSVPGVPEMLVFAFPQSGTFPHTFTFLKEPA